jgi:hypothetical protein
VGLAGGLSVPVAAAKQILYLQGADRIQLYNQAWAYRGNEYKKYGGTRAGYQIKPAGPGPYMGKKIFTSIERTL